MKTGLGIRAELFNPVLEQQPDVGFFEAHSENYFSDPLALSKLLALREHYPVSLHGVGLSLGRADDLDWGHLQKLRTLVDMLEPFHISEHLSWSAYSHVFVPDLLPLPLTDQALKIMCEHIDQMQQALGRQILIENPSNYMLFDQMAYSEPEFLNQLASRTGCGLLVDVNNIVVSSHNLKRDALGYVNALNSDYVQQYHLAGYQVNEQQGGTLYIDTHNHEVYPQTWELYRQTVERHGAKACLLEWDSDFPDMSVLLNECQTADKVVAEVKVCRDTPSSHGGLVIEEPAPIQKNEDLRPSQESAMDLPQFQETFLDQVLMDGIREGAMFVYQRNVVNALYDYLADVYPACSGIVGKVFFRSLVNAFIAQNPPEQGDIHDYGAKWGEVIFNLAEFKEGLAAVPYLKDVCRLEWQLHRLWYAKLPELLALSNFDQEALLTKSMRLNPMSTIVSSEFPLYEIHRQSLPDFTGDVAIHLHQSSDTILVYKRDYRVMHKVLNACELDLIRMFTTCCTFLQAMEALQRSYNHDVISAALSFLMDVGLCEPFEQNSGDNDVDNGV